MACESRVHFCDKTTSKNKNCGDCTQQLYAKLNEEANIEGGNAKDWISTRKVAGHVVYTCNRALQQGIANNNLKIYVTAKLTSLRKLAAHIGCIEESELELFYERLGARLHMVMNARK